MAVILKSDMVTVEAKKRLDYTKNLTEPVVPVNSGTKLVDQDIDDSLVVDDVGTVGYKSDYSEPDEIESDYKHLDGMILYHGHKYYREDRVDERVALLVEKKNTNLEEQNKELMEDAKTDGYESGIAIAKEEYQLKQQELAELVNNINHEIEAKVTENNEYLRDIILVAITRILGDKLSDNENRIDLIKTVIDSIASSSPFILKLSKTDYDILMNDNALNMTINAEKIISDSRVTTGGCIIETDKGIFDGRLEVQLTRLKEAIDTSNDK